MRRAALRGRVEGACPARDDVARGERRPVVEGDAAAQMEGVGEAVGRDVPAFGERGFDFGVRVESASVRRRDSRRRDRWERRSRVRGRANADRTDRASRSARGATAAPEEPQRSGGHASAAATKVSDEQEWSGDLPLTLVDIYSGARTYPIPPSSVNQMRPPEVVPSGRVVCCAPLRGLGGADGDQRLPTGRGRDSGAHEVGMSAKSDPRGDGAGRTHLRCYGSTAHARACACALLAHAAPVGRAAGGMRPARPAGRGAIAQVRGQRDLQRRRAVDLRRADAVVVHAAPLPVLRLQALLSGGRASDRTSRRSRRCTRTTASTTPRSTRS